MSHTARKLFDLLTINYHSMIRFFGFPSRKSLNRFSDFMKDIKKTYFEYRDCLTDFDEGKIQDISIMKNIPESVQGTDEWDTQNRKKQCCLALFRTPWKKAMNRFLKFRKCLNPFEYWLFQVNTPFQTFHMFFIPVRNNCHR